jgi:hypothetical protein
MEEGRVMTSDKQADANRRNARKSTGPKTPEGKAVARLNALKHGLLSQELLLPGEDEAALNELSELLMAELQPVGAMETLLVRDIIVAHWRLRRLRMVEAGIFARQLREELIEQAESEARSYERDTAKEILNQMTPITDEQKHQQALAKVEELKAEQETETATLGQAFIRDANEANAFSKLSRYETPIWRSFYRALHELQRLQAARRAEGSVTPPVAVDLDVSGVPGEDI